MIENSTVVTCDQIEKTYSQGSQVVQVLKGVDLKVGRGERIAIVGSSGSGKTTLLNVLGGIDLPTSGNVTIAGKNLALVDEAARGLLRNEHLGFVYQFHHLLGEFSALENVCMPLLIAKLPMTEAAERARIMLGKVGLDSRVEHKPSELSGGERQRVAIARALVTEPSCVLLDEPTGNLDRGTATEIHALMNELNERLEISFIVVTHDELLASSMERKFLLVDGLLNEQ